MRNDGADDPGRPSATPSSEAGRVNGRLKRLRQRSTAVQDQVARRREELERSRHVGLLLLVQRRFKEIEGGDLSVLITLSLFVAMVPVALLCFSWLTGFSSSANLASLVIRHYDLLSAVQAAGRAGQGQASGPHPGVSVGSRSLGPLQHLRAWREGGAAG